MNRSNYNCCPIVRLGVPGLILASFLGGMFALSSGGFMQASNEGEKVLRHVVMFKFKDESSQDEVQKVVDAFRALPSQIPEIRDFEYGTDNSPEGLSNGFTHCFLVTFHSEEDRTVYLPHPAHKAFVEVLKPHLDKVQVIDYWAAK